MGRGKRNRSRLRIRSRSRSLTRNRSLTRSRSRGRGKRNRSRLRIRSRSRSLTRSGSRYRAKRNRSKSFVSISIKVSGQEASLIIGEKGDRIKAIERRTCTKIRILGSRGDMKQKIKVFGPENQVNIAKFMMNQILTNHRRERK